MTYGAIALGEYSMGSATLSVSQNAFDDERPQHVVRITKAFYIGVHEVTQKQYQAIMNTTPSYFVGDNRPVERVSWDDARSFCRRLCRKEGVRYRLPTEAEWEYACRAGTTTVFHFGNSLSAAQANFNGKYPFGDAKPGKVLNRTATVGSYPANAFGLYDMHGNLNEWCADKFGRDYYRVSPAKDPHGPDKGTSPVIRGGDWYSDARDCRSAFRYADIPEGTFYALGFRVVCEISTGGVNVAAKDPGRKTPSTPIPKVTTGEQPAPTSGEDWPRWRGPRGNGTWRAPKLSSSWPQDGLQRAWQQEIGGGYGGVAVSGGRAYVMDRQKKPDDVERVLCFDAVDGTPLWSHSYAVDYGNVMYANGPRTTPTIFRGHVYTLGAVGHLHCLDAVNGDIVWSQDLVGDFAARVPGWGLSASPLVFQDLLIVHPGAKSDGCFIAFDLNTGKERWRSLPDPAGFATPILIDHRGTRQLVCWTPDNICGLNPETGELLWTIPFEVNYGTSIATPMFEEGLVLVSSYYEGSKAIRLGEKPGDAKEAWKDRRNLRGLMSQPLYRDRHAYLLDKRHGLTCFEFATGKKLWDDDNRLTPKGRNPQATMVWLNDEDRAIVLNSDGDLILARFNPQQYVEEARANIIGRTWAHPAYAGNCVYARSDTEIVCVLLPREK